MRSEIEPKQHTYLFPCLRNLLNREVYNETVSIV